MTAADSQSIWSQLPPGILEQIAEDTRDVAAGLTVFRSVCRAWRAAAREAPRLLLPVPLGSAAPRAGSEHALVFPLARSWSAVVDVRDTSCRLSHLATGATAALPNLNAVRATPTSRVVNIGYEHFDALPAAAPETTAGVRVPRHRRSFQMKIGLRTAAAAAAVGDRNPGRRRRTRWRVRMDPRWKKSLIRSDPKPSPSSENKIQIESPFGGYFYIDTNLQFSSCIRFGVHVPPGAPAASSDGMMIMACHPLHGQTGLVFCRPGDAAWTKLDNTVIEDDGHSYNGSSLFSFADFAYSDGKIFAVDVYGGTAVFDAATLEVLDVVDLPPETVNFSTKMFGCCNAAAEGSFDNKDQRSYLHLVALPSKLLCVRVHVRSSKPEGFDIFELASDRHGVAWRKVVVGLDGIVGDCDLFLDGHHATFHRGHGEGRIYYIHDTKIGGRTAAAYGYSMKDDSLECLYRPQEESDCEYSTKPSWFVP